MRELAIKDVPTTPMILNVCLAAHARIMQSLPMSKWRRDLPLGGTKLVRGETLELHQPLDMWCDTKGRTYITAADGSFRRVTDKPQSRKAKRNEERQARKEARIGSHVQSTPKAGKAV